MCPNIPYSVDEDAIQRVLGLARGTDPGRVREVLAKGRQMKGLDPDDVAHLMEVQDPELLDDLFRSAKSVKEEIYGNRIVLFAPLYISNLCSNECTYCAFRASNRDLPRRALTQGEIAGETRALIRTGQKRTLLVAGEGYPGGGLDYVLEAIRTIYDTREGRGEIRRLNVNIAPLTIEGFRRLKESQIGTYQLFQETYDRRTYEQVHPRGLKANFAYRLEAMDRAMEAGIDDVGIGVLFGLADWRFEVLALMQHSARLEKRFGCGPHTISIPRIEPAVGSELSERPPCPVTDPDFKKLIAILRLAVPYTGMILSTRESPGVRRDCLELGISQISAGSRTDPGGYGREDTQAAQFSLGDHRSLDEVVRDLAHHGFIPSFCTACYRLGRVGADFMDLAKPGEIKAHCQPNAIATFLEYLEDYAGDETRSSGMDMIEKSLASLPPSIRKRSQGMLERILLGERDVFC